MCEESRLSRCDGGCCRGVDIQDAGVIVPLYTSFLDHVEDGMYRGTSLIIKRSPPWAPSRALGIGLRYGPSGVHCLMSEVALYRDELAEKHPTDPRYPHRTRINSLLGRHI